MFYTAYGQFFIVDKPYKIMLKSWNGKTASEENGVLGQTDMELFTGQED